MSHSPKLKKLMAELQEALTEELLDRVQNGEVDEEGNRTPASSAVLNVARQILKDNGIDGTAPASDEDKFAQLKKHLDDLPFDAEDASTYRN